MMLSVRRKILHDRMSSVVKTGKAPLQAESGPAVTAVSLDSARPLPLTRDNRVVCIYFSDHADVQGFAEACYRFSPQLAVREREAVFLEMWGSRKLFGERSLRLRLQSLLRRFDREGHVAFAATAGEALARARFQVAPNAETPLAALSDLASPFGDNAKLRARLRPLQHSLHTLGIHTIEAFQQLSPRALALRFGRVGPELSQLLRQPAGQVWPRFTPQPVVTESCDLDALATPGQSGSVEQLLALYEGLLDRAMARLWARGLRASGLELELELENLSTVNDPQRRIQMDLAAPQGSTRILLPLIRNRLEYEFARLPLHAAVERIRVRITDTAPASCGQRDFFRSTQVEQESWNSLVTRLQARLPQDSFFLAATVDRYLPEAAWQRQAATFPALRVGPNLGSKTVTDEGQEHRVARPTRLLSVPQPLWRQGSDLRHHKWRKRWRIERMEGPERLSGEWWQAPPQCLPFHRDYYKVFTTEGEILWIYSEPQQNGRIYLQGFFD